MIQVRSEAVDGAMRFTAWLDGRVCGAMLITVMPLVHDMEIEPGLMQRKTAEALFHYASGYTKASGFSEALVLCSEQNEPMKRYLEERTTPEEPSHAYLMEVL